MADGHGPDAPHVADALRRVIAVRGRKRARLRIALIAGLPAVAAAASLFWKAPILFVWNASASAPTGLYRLHHDGPVRRGDLVIARMPEPLRALAAWRHYLPANVPLVKRVAAAAGDRVCTAGHVISINGQWAAIRRKRDAAGRPMPWWSGCRRLRSGEYFLLTDSPWSFDGRYFGLTRAADVLGRAELIWPSAANRPVQ